MVGRFITGMMGGAFSLTAPAYTSEISEKEIRGTLGTYFQLMITFGILFVYGVGSAVSVSVLSIICGCVPLLFGAIFWFMPETPLYYLTKGQRERAQSSLQWFRGKYWHTSSIFHLLVEAVKKHDSQFTYLRHISVIIFALGKQYVLLNKMFISVLTQHQYISLVGYMFRFL
jgi:MFS family permease